MASVTNATIPISKSNICHGLQRQPQTIIAIFFSFLFPSASSLSFRLWLSERNSELAYCGHERPSLCPILYSFLRSKETELSPQVLPHRNL